MGLESSIWRQLTAISVAWLFALQMVLATLASVVALSSYRADQAIGATLCLPGGANADQPATPPSSVPGDHCPLCVASGHAVAVTVVVLPTAIVYVSRLRWMPTGVQFNEPPTLDGARSRGPPDADVTLAFAA